MDVLITGATKGIGEATARRLASADTGLLLVARSADPLAALAEDLTARTPGLRAHPCAADLGARVPPRRLPPAREAGLELDAVILNAADVVPGPRGGPLYSVSNWALRGYAVNLRAELQEEGIDVAHVSPGNTLTGSWEGIDVDPARILRAEDIAAVIHTTLHLSPQALIEDVVVRPVRGNIG